MIISEVRTDLLDIARRYAARPLDWPRAPIFDPSSRWYARLAVQNLVLEHLERMDPQWPAADFDVEAEKERLAKS